MAVRYDKRFSDEERFSETELALLDYLHAVQVETTSLLNDLRAAHTLEPIPEPTKEEVRDKFKGFLNSNRRQA